MPNKSINGVTMNYQERGRGPAIVLVHGFPLDSRIWQAQLEALSDRYRVIAPDLRGFGQSKPPGPMTVDSLADDLHALLGQLGALPCVFGGLSMGGYVALAMARKYPTDLRGLILIDTRAEGDTPEGKENRNKMIASLRPGGTKAVADAMFPKMIHSETAEHRQDIAHKLRQIMESQDPATVEQAIIALRDRPDRIGELKLINTPTHIIVGEHDAITPVAMSRTMEQGIPSATLTVIPKAGHMSPMEQAEDVTTAIRRFAEKVTAK